MAFNPAFEIAFLTEDEQKNLIKAMNYTADEMKKKILEILQANTAAFLYSSGKMRTYG